MRRKQNRYTTKQRRAVRDLYTAGLLTPEIEARTGVGVSTIEKWAKDEGYSRSPSESLRLKWERTYGETWRRAADLYATGRYTYGDIARMLGCGKATVSQGVRRFGCTVTFLESRHRQNWDARTVRGRQRAAMIAAIGRERSEGATLAELSERFHYSERHIQRLLRSEHNPYRIDAETQARAIASAAERRGTERANGRRAA